MNISNKYILAERLEEVQQGFKTVEVQDNFIYKGKVIQVPDTPVFMDNRRVGVGDIVFFAKYSPDTHEIDLDNKKLKFVAISDLLAVL